MRLKQLDILRAVAILLVLGRHLYLVEIWHRGGWCGVDLFFVLSGFLISGLLFSEYKNESRLHVGRFLIRRGFKIYPAFYVLIAWSAAMFVVSHHAVPRLRLFSELFFLQSYIGGIWEHTWSLAVEEHFYLLLPVLLIVLIRLSTDRKDPFRALPVIFAVVAAGVLGVCLYRSWPDPESAFPGWYMTHLHMDSLLCGVVISYFFHFREREFQRFAASRRGLLLGMSCLLVAPVFVLELARSYYVQTVGHTLLYLGFGGILIWSLPQAGVALAGAPSWISRAGSALAWVGRYSYSIYLWHGPLAAWGLEALRQTKVLPQSRGLQFSIYFVASILLGAAMAKVVEYPALRVRDKFFPSRRTTAATARRLESSAAKMPAPEARAVTG